MSENVASNQLCLFDKETLDSFLVFPLVENNDSKYTFRASFEDELYFKNKLVVSSIKRFVDEYNSSRSSQRLNKNVVVPALKSLSMYVGKESFEDVDLGDLALLYLSVRSSIPNDVILNYNHKELSKFRKLNGIDRYGLSQHVLLIAYADSVFKSVK